MNLRIRKIVTVMLTVVMLAGMAIGLAACNNESAAVNYAKFVFSENEKAPAKYINVITDDFKKEATIYDALKLANYKYGFEAKFDEKNPDMPFLKSVAGLQPDITQFIGIYISDVNADVNKDCTKTVDNVTYYMSNKGIAEINLQPDVSYLFELDEWDNGSAVWKQKLSSSWMEGLSDPIIAGDYLYIIKGAKLLKLNKATGEQVKEVEMKIAEGSTSFYALSAPAYADGKIFCAYNGKIQAFDSDLNSLWIYTDSIGGAANSPIVYDNGYIYTGFWNGEDSNANYVCIDTKDENVNDAYENKTDRWSYTRKGGYYWAGGVIIGNYIVIGGEDGEKAAAKTTIDAFNKATGEISDQKEIFGDNRSGIAYEETKKSVYFTTNAGKLYRIWFNKENGTFKTVKETDLKYGYTTCTPVIVGNRLYVSSGANGNGAIQVIDADVLKEIYSVDTEGYSQTTPLVKTYRNGDIYENFVYFTVNKNEGGLYYFVDRADSTYSFKKNLFIPEKDDANWCISKISKGDNGVMYYRNDSGTLFAYKHPSYAQEVL